MVGGLATKATGRVLDMARQRGGAEPSVVTLHDHSRFGNDGTFVNNPTWVQLPSGLWVLNFVAASLQYIDCGNDDSLNPTNELTLSVWASFNSLGSHNGLISKYRNTAWALWKTNADKASTRMLLDAQVSLSSTTLLVADHWYYFALTHKPADTRLFLDGVQVNFSNQVGLIRTTNVTMKIGCLQDAAGAPTFYHDGYIALPRIYNYALTPGQIVQRYEATKRLFGV